MRLTELEFCSLLTYSPHGNSETELRSKTVMSDLKNDKYITLNSKQTLMSEYLAEGIKKHLDTLHFAEYFKVNPILIPTPKSSLSKSNTIWVPQRLANALVNEGLGREVRSLLQREKPVAKYSTSLPKYRPKAIDHYNSMVVKKTLDDPKEILLVDDVITRGATLLGAANKLADIFPNTRIRAFAFMRTMSPRKFKNIFDPCKGEIILRDDGNTFRNP
ncbi:MAG: hypothetical protein ACK4TO_09515 [Candidatus Nitrosotenuis sp.]